MTRTRPTVARPILALLLLLLAATIPAAGSTEADAFDEAERDPDRPAVVMPAPLRDAAFVSGGIRRVPGFRTDFSRSLVPDSQILSGGPSKDGIPSIDSPAFLAPGRVDWLADREPVLVVTAGGEARVYPLQILTYHEIVNDEVGGVPLAVTYCPLCNTGIVFRREVDGRLLDFGTTGRLRYSNLLMYDRQTETWWQQATGEALVGEHAGARLRLHPVLMLPYRVAVERFPEALVLSRDTGYSRPYGTNPYSGYDTLARPFLYQGPAVGADYAPLTRVVQVVEGGESAVIPYPVLEESRLVQVEVAGSAIVVFWEPGTASALDTREIQAGRDVGGANAFYAELDGRVLSFSPAGASPAGASPAGSQPVGASPTGGFIDAETGSRWNGAGLAVSGPLAGRALEPAVGIQHFWFSAWAFESDGAWEPLR